MAALPPPEASMIAASLPVRRVLAWLDARAASEAHNICEQAALRRVAKINGGTLLVRSEQEVRLAFSEGFHGNICISLSPESRITKIWIEVVAQESATRD